MLSSSSTIFIFGPSCSGKSTVCEALQKELGDEWTYIDRDVLIEAGVCTSGDADRTIDERIQGLRKVIVDTQIPWRPKKEGEAYFLLLPPLDVLLKRNEWRALRLKRTRERHAQATKYVVNTFNKLNSMQDCFDQCFDSSQQSVADIVCEIQMALL